MTFNECSYLELQDKGYLLGPFPDGDYSKVPPLSILIVLNGLFL